MPIQPIAPPVNYDVIDTAMNMARVRLNDCPLGLSGNLLASTQPYAQTFFNLALRTLQEDLAEAGEPRCTQETVIPSLPIVANIDPVTQVFLSQQWYFDGQNYYSTPNVNLLPQDMIFPLWIRERLAGSSQLFTPMQPCDDGLPGGPKTTFLRYWEWRNDALYMPGAIVPRDLWMRYASFVPDAIDNSPVANTPWYQQQLPFMRSADTIAFYVCAEFAFSRGSEQANAVANSFLEMGRAGMRKMLNRTMKIRQRINHRRRPYSAYRHQGWNWW